MNFRFVKVFVSVLVSCMFLVSCGSDDDDVDTAPSPSTSDDTSGDDVSTPAATDPSQCVDADAAQPGPGSSFVLTFGGGPVEQVMVDVVIPAFTEETGIEVVYAPNTTAEAMAKVIAQDGNPDVDLVITAETPYLSALDAGVLAELDIEVLPAMEDLPEELILEGNAGITLGTFSQGISYSTEALEEAGLEPPESILDLFEDDYAGHVGLWVPPQATGISFVRIVNHLIGGEVDDLTPALEKIAEVRPDAAEVASSVGPMAAAITDGRVWVWFDSQVVSGILAGQGLPVAIVFPEGETFHRSQIGVIPEGARDGAAACTFLNWILTQAGQENFVELNFAPVRDSVDAPERHVPFFAEESQSETAVLGNPQDPQEVTQMWNEIVGG